MKEFDLKNLLMECSKELNKFCRNHGELICLKTLRSIKNINKKLDF